MSVTIVCVLVAGPVPYNADYVYRLKRMCERYISRPFRFVCLTDNLSQLKGIETIAITNLGDSVPANGRGYWSKMEVFNHRHGLFGRVLYLDLDTLVVSSLDPIIDFPAQLALTEDAFVVERAHLDTDRYGRKLVRRFNGSVMVWDAGVPAHLFEEWAPDVAQRLSTDQDFIGEKAPYAKAMSLSWFPRISHLVRDEHFAATGKPWPPEAKVVLTKKPKNMTCAHLYPWFDAVWGGWSA